MLISRALLLAGLIVLQLGCLSAPQPQPEPVTPQPVRSNTPPPEPEPEVLPTLRDASGAWLLKILPVRCSPYVVKLAQPAADQVHAIAQGLRTPLEEELGASTTFALVDDRAPFQLQVMVLEYKQTGVADLLGYAVTVTGTVYDAGSSDILYVVKGNGSASRPEDTEAHLRGLAEKRAAAALVRALEDGAGQMR